jgi:hypothetical protein
MEPTQPINMSPDQLRRQAELIAASQTPSGILRQPLSDEQLLQFSNQAIGQQQNIAAINAQKEAQKLAEIEAQNKTQAELTALGLKPPVAQPMPVSMPQTQVSDSDVVSRGGVVIPGEMQGKELATQPVAPTNSYQNLIMSGVNAQDAASQRSLDATDQIMKQYEMNQARLQQSRFDAENELKKKIGEIDQKQKDFTWDNRSLWEKSSTGQKVMIAITGFLSSLSPQGAKTFQDTVSNTMARDLDQQKERYNLLKEQKKDYQSLYGDLVKKFGDEDMASLQLTNMQLNAVSNRLKVLSEMSQSKIVAAKSLQGIDLVNSEIAKNQATMVNLAAAKKSDVIPGYENTITDKTAKEKFSQTLAGKKTLDATLADLETLVKGTGEAIPFTTKNVRAKQLVQDAQLQMKEIKKLGVLSGDDAKRLEDYISKPSLFKSDAIMLEQIKGMRDLANKALKAQETTYGLVPSGSNIGRVK